MPVCDMIEVLRIFQELVLLYFSSENNNQTLLHWPTYMIVVLMIFQPEVLFPQGMCLEMYFTGIFSDDVTQIAKWLACIYRSMDDFQENSTLISTLRGMKVIPLSTGQLVSLDEVTVFMLSDAGASSDKPAPGKRGTYEMG